MTRTVGEVILFLGSVVNTATNHCRRFDAPLPVELANHARDPQQNDTHLTNSRFIGGNSDDEILGSLRSVV